MLNKTDGCPPEWVDTVWRLNSPTIYKLCEIKCESIEDAKDLFQTVALKFCQNAVKLKDRESALPWLISVARTSFLDMVAENHSTYVFSRCKESTGDCFALPESASIFYEKTQSENFGEFEKLMEILNPLERMIFDLHYVGNLSMEEIGSVVGLSSNAIRKRKHKALLKLREKWKSL